VLYQNHEYNPQNKDLKSFSTILLESLASESRRWAFRRRQEHKLDKYFRQLAETGIYAIAIRNETRRNMLERLNGSRLLMDKNK